MGIARLPTDGAPAAGRRPAAKVGPLGEVRFAEDDRTGRSQLTDQEGIDGGRPTVKCERTGGRPELTGAVDVVLHEYRKAVQWAEVLARRAAGVADRRLLEGGVVQADEGADLRAGSVDCRYPLEE